MGLQVAWPNIQFSRIPRLSRFGIREAYLVAWRLLRCARNDKIESV
jgi:hypothetical protein